VTKDPSATREEFIARAPYRLQRLNWITAIAGTAIAYFWKGFPAGAGFAAGALFSILNFEMWKLLSGRIGEPVNGKPRKASLVFLALRFLIFAAGGYVILRYSEVSAMAALTGCFVSTIAVILEIFYELIYAGT
jgi:hypothetical protein